MKTVSVLLATFFALTTCSVFAADFDAEEATYSPASVLWATPVHNLMIEVAFPKESPNCIRKMQQGSYDADMSPYQGSAYTHMHAMRSKGQLPAEASKKMWAFIDSKFAEARAMIKAGQIDKACHARGMALHPIMDSTSPAHHDFEEWDPIEFKTLFDNLPGKLAHMAEHGDVQKYIDQYILLPMNISKEDMNVIDGNPMYLDLTAEIMRKVNAEGMKN